MEEESRRNLIGVLTKLNEAFRQRNVARLRELSNANLRREAAFQDADSLAVTVVAYALSKIITRTRRRGIIESQLSGAINALNSGMEKKYRATIKALVKGIESEDSELTEFVSGVLEQVKIKKGRNLCESGMSMARAADLLNVSKWELAHYLRKACVGWRSSENVTTEQRLALAERLFS